jgi:DNA-directed RNA polymerase specialized sigma24 family protein
MRIAAEVLALAQQGDHDALTRLLTNVQPDVRRYARRQCHRASVLEDVVQEALIVVYRKVGQIGSPAALAGWLFTVMHRLCMLPVLMLTRGAEQWDTIEEGKHFTQRCSS